MDKQKPVLFDFKRLQRNRNAAIKRFGEFDFLFEKAADRVLDNLRDIQRDFHDIAIIGMRGADKIKAYFKGENVTMFDSIDGADVVMMEEIPPFEPQSYDCIIAMPYLHTVNDVPLFLQTVKAALKPDGLFLCAFFGGLTLTELRQSIMQAELQEYFGADQHIHPMIDHYQCAGLFQSAGFGLPVVDFDRVHVRYAEIQTLYGDIIGMGEGNGLSAKPKPIAPIKPNIEAHYKTHFYDGGFVATFDMIHAIGWAPHDSQQKPARRGSGQISLTEIL